MLKRLATVPSFLAALITSTPAWGQATPAVPLAAEQTHAGDGSEYRQLIARGIAEFNLGHWTESRAFFLRAHALRPNARTLRTLGLVSYELRDYVDTLNYLEQALASTERPLTPEMRVDVQTALQEARSFVTQVVVVLEPSDASLRVDGRPVTLPTDRTLLLNPGEHEFQAELMGFKSATRTLHGYGGDQSEVRLRLEPLHEQTPVATAAVGPTVASEATDGSWFDSPSGAQYAGLAVATVGVIGLGVGTTLSVLAVNENQASNETCTRTRCDAAGGQHRRDAQDRADAATVSFIAAGVLIGTGAALVFFTGGAERETATAELTPIVSPALAGVSYRGAL